jgi:hypothetical protein
MQGRRIYPARVSQFHDIGNAGAGGNAIAIDGGVVYAASGLEIAG